ncbi:MAG: cytochrome P450, partial [Gammaproteobacteria bacterium]
MQLTPDTVQHFVLGDVDLAFAKDPYPGYQILRDYAPFCTQPDGSLVLTRYDGVKRALSDPVLFSSDKRVDFQPKFGATPLYEHHTT